MSRMLGAFALILLVAPAAAAQNHGHATTDTVAIRRTLQAADSAFSAAYMNDDFDAIAAAYTEDAVAMPPGGPIRGKAAIRALFEHGPNLKILDHRLVMESLTIKDGMAMEVGSYSIRTQVGQNEPNTSGGHYMLVWRLEADGVWRILGDMWNSPPAPR